MKNVDYQMLRRDRYENRCKMADAKAEEYASKDDRLTNFKEVGRFVGVTPLQVAAIYLYKHIRGILAFTRDSDRNVTEPIEGRIDDAQEYLDLMAGLIQELRNADTITGPPY